MTSLRSSLLFVLLVVCTLVNSMPTMTSSTTQSPQQELTETGDVTSIIDRAHDNPAEIDDDTIPEETTFSSNDTTFDFDNNGTLSANDTDTTNGAIDDVYKSVRDHTDAANAGRDKTRRLEVIRALILDTTGRKEQPHGGGTGPANVFRDLKSIFESMLPWSSVDGYTEKVQSFYPVCVVPKGASDIPEEREGMNLHFNLSYPTPLEGSVLNILAAKLKLYKLSQAHQGNTANSNVACAPRRNVDTAALEAAAAAAAAAASGFELPLPLPVPPVSAEPYVEDDRRVRVSVYYYLKAQRKNRLRRKLLDTKMVPVTGEEWVELNVRAAARSWRNMSKNLGLVVEVEDEEGKPLPAAKYFSDMNCSKEAATSRPIPSFLLDAARERNGYQNASLQYNTDLFPVIDLCTMDLPKHDRKPPATAAVPAVPSATELHTKHMHNGDEVTSVVLLPYSKVAELANKHNENPGEDDEEELLESGKNNSETKTQPITLTQQEEDESIIPEQKQYTHEALVELPELPDTQNEQPMSLNHPHRHHRHHHQQHLVHSHEEASEWSPQSDLHPQKSHPISSSPEDESDEWQIWPKKQPHRLHQRYHHHGHRFHSVGSPNDQDWSEESSSRLIVVPASELLSLSEDLERDEARVQHTLHQDDDLER